MFPLAGNSYPTSSDELARGIRDALAEMFTFPNPNSVIRIEGDAWPAIDRLTVDLGGAIVRVSQPPPKPVPQESREPGITIGQLQVLGHPIRYQQSRLDLDVAARNVRTEFSHDSTGRALILLADASDGHVETQIGKADLQSAMRAAATEAAKPQGVTIQDLQVSLASDGVRSLAGEVRVKAKKMMMSGVVVVRGKVEIDQDMIATLSNLTCTGEGMIGGMAAAMVNSKLRLYEGKRVPLMAFALGDVTLRGLRITTDDPIAVRAEFGGKSK
jgi:hypothetical protein